MSAERVEAAPWDRLPDEPTAAYRRFWEYVHMGPGQRSIRTLVERLRHAGDTRFASFSTIAEFSRTFRWVERADAWDQDQDRLRAAAAIAQVPAMAERQATLGLRLQRLALAKLRLYVPRYDDEGRVVALRPGQRYADEIPLPDALRMAELGVRLERIARGEGDPSAPVVGPVSVVTNPVLAAVRLDPSRVGEVAELLSRIVDGTATRAD